MSYQLAIFDLDGTILDTLEDLKDSVNYALARNGFPLKESREIRAFLGNGMKRLIELSLPEGFTREQYDAVYPCFKEHYELHCKDKTKPYPGIRELVKSLKSRGILTAVVSNKGDFAVQELCLKYFRDCFDYVVGEREGIRRKPAPDTVNAVLKELKVPKEEAVYIGDSEVDLETAKNAGMDCISVTWGFRDRPVLEDIGARILVDDPEEIQKIIFE